jgi:hypothetical protein
MCNEVEISSAQMICFHELLQQLKIKIKKNILSHISCFFKGKTLGIVFFLENISPHLHTQFLILG